MLHRGVLGRDIEHARRRQPRCRLPEELGPGPQTPGIAQAELAVVVDDTDDAEGQRAQQHDPDEAAAEIRPKQCAHDDRHQNQHAAHGGRAGLGQMAFRTHVADGLPDPPGRQPPDDEGAQRERQNQRRECAENGPHGDVTEYVERGKILGQVLGDVDQHAAFLLSPLVPSEPTRRSRPITLDPLTSNVASSVSRGSNACRNAVKSVKDRDPEPKACAAS